MVVGIFDLGSNSFIALVLDGKEDVFEDVRVVKTAFYLKDGILKDCERFKEVFDSMKERVRAYTENIHVFGTAIFREARNGRECFELIKGGLPGRVLSGKEEALYSYLSVLWDEELKVKDPIVLDLGGGSLEVIRGEKDYLSLPFGTRKVLDLIEGNTVDEVVEGIVEALPGWKGKAVGIGGTFVTLASSILGRWSIKEVHGKVLTREIIEKLIFQYSRMSTDEIESLPYVPRGRGATLFPGSVVTLALSIKYGEIVVSRRGYRYGLGWEIERRRRNGVPGGI